MKSKKALFRALCVITALAPAAPAALLTDSFESPGPGNLPAGWRAGFHGNVSASVVRDASVARSGNASVCFANRSPLAANVWVSLTRETPVPVAGLDALTLSLHARGVAAGRAFVSVVFQPSGGETRLYLPEGDFPWRRVAQDIPVPDGAASVILRIGSEAPSTALHLDDLSLEPCPRKLSGLPALFLPRQPAADGSVRLFPSAPPPDPDLTVLDIARLDQDEQLLATTLQGLVNTTRPRLYLVHNPNDRFWLARLLGQKHIRSASELPSLAAAVEKFRGEIAGVTVPDPAVPATRHTAMLLGALDATVATSRQAAARYNLPVKTDLAGRFSKNVQAYRHLWENHRGRLASHVLAVHHPAMTHNGPRDYLAQQRVFTFWISSYADPHPAADPAAEMEFAAEVLAATPPNIPVMGWFSFGDTQGLPEYDAVRLVSGYAKFLAGSEFNTNLSLLSGIRVPAKTFRQRRQPAPPAPDTPAVLLSFSVMDSGDSLWYWQHYQHKHWLDPERGSVPVNWSMNPTLPDLLPSVAQWFYENATPNDLLYTAISGLGYMNPTLYASRFAPDDREKIWDDYLSLLDQYMRRLDHNILGLYAGSWNEPRSSIHPVLLRLAKLPNLLGVLSDFGRHDATTPRNALQLIPRPATDATAAPLPVLHTSMRWLQWSLTSEVAAHKADATLAFTLSEVLSNAPAERPAFMSGLILSWTMSPSLIKRLADKLPPDFRPVPADTLLRAATKHSSTP